STLEQPQRSFYNGDYDRAAAVTDVLCAAGPDALEAWEPRTASLPSPIKTALRNTDARAKSSGWTTSPSSPALTSGFPSVPAARGWVDYIVGSTVPRGARWVLGGGNKKRGLLSLREVAEAGSGEFFDRVEAMFALWDMQVREREVAGAVATARTLARDFPENRELRRILTIHDPTA